MRQIKKWCIRMVLVLVTLGFVQAAGGYLSAQLNKLGAIEQQPHLSIEEKVIKQHVLQLKPQAYYTIQLGSYTDEASGQKRIDQLAQAGYRVHVSKEPPYRLRLGCMGTAPILDDLPDELFSEENDVFVEKRILNQYTLQFSEEDLTQWQDIAALIASLDVVLAHSLQLFQDYRYESCSRENWNGMIAQVQQELDVIITSSEDVLKNPIHETHAEELLELIDFAGGYRESLSLIREKENTQMVLLAQSCLLELIDCYHTFIEQCSAAANAQ